MTPARFKEIRKALSLSQDQLAAQLECARATINNYETGKTAIPWMASAAMMWLKLMQEVNAADV